MPGIRGNDPSVFLSIVSQSQQTTIKGNTTASDSNGMTTPNYRITTSPSKGSVSINSSSGDWSYNPNLGYTGSDSFAISATDDSNNVSSTTIDLNIEQDPSAASTAGDPYVWPIKSEVPVKLPNASAVYRMFEQDDCYVNAYVGEATDEHKDRMKEFLDRINVNLNVKPIIDGYFYQHLFIHSEGHEMMIDLCKKSDSYANQESKEYFKNELCSDVFNTAEFNAPCNKFTIYWTTSKGIRQSVSVLFFANPHLENGITMRTSTLENATGMMIDNYKPKLMKVPSLTTTSYDKLWRKLSRTKKQHHFMDIKPKREGWVYGNSNGKLLVK